MQNVSFRSSGMCRKQNFEIISPIWGFKSDTAVLFFSLPSSSFDFLAWVIFFYFAGHSVGLILVGKGIRKAFRIRIRGQFHALHREWVKLAWLNFEIWCLMIEWLLLQKMKKMEKWGRVQWVRLCIKCSHKKFVTVPSKFTSAKRHYSLRENNNTRFVIMGVFLLTVRTVLMAIIGFMPTQGAGAIGSLDYTPQERKVLAKK